MKQPLHILHLSSAKSWRGGEQQIAYLATEMKRQSIPQIIACVADAPLNEWCIKQQIPCFPYQKRASLDPILSFRIRQLCRQQDITHIHAHDSHAHTFAFVAASIFGNQTPILLSRRVDFPIKHSFFSHLKYNHSSIRKIICVSHSIKRVISPVIKDSDKLTVIHSGIDVSRFQVEADDSLRATYQLNPNAKIIINVAALSVHKDHATFIRTAERLLQQRNELVFFIVGGDAGSEQDIEALIEEKGLNDHIFLTGYRTDIPNLLRQADVFLFTSKEEGLGTSVLDAFAAQLPVVTTAAGGISEMVVHHETGYLAAIGDDKELATGVTRLLEDNEQRLSYIRAASQLLTTEFTHQKMASTTIALYRTVI
ncbi:MAG: glycosyltransferase family 4 protein [Bacteroidota bacterium]